MRERFSRSMSPAAVVIAVLALGVALGGGAYAASVKLGKNAVKTKNIKNAAVTEKKIAGGAVTEAKLADGSVSGAKLKGCKSGTTLVIGFCFDSSAQGPATWFNANNDCAARGGSLPTAAQILATRNTPGFDLGTLATSSSHWASDIQGSAEGTSVSDANAVSIAISLNSSRSYRCIFERLG
jgi:hypothetical protein